jgi:hypothetical protein
MTTTDPAPSLMDNLEFMAELENMEGPKRVASSNQLSDRVHEMKDGFVPAQPRPRLRVVAPERAAAARRARQSIPDRNVFHPAPLEQDEQDDETSVTIPARVAALAVMASALAGAGAAALVFHARLAQLFQ